MFLTKRTFYFKCALASGNHAIRLVINHEQMAKMICAKTKNGEFIGLKISNFKVDDKTVVANKLSKIIFQAKVRIKLIKIIKEIKEIKYL